MSTASAGLREHSLTADHPDQAAGHHQRAAGLFEKDHAYAARLVQTAAVIRSVVRSTMISDRVASEIEGDHRDMASGVSQSRVQKSGS